MSGREVGYRIRQQVQASFEKIRARNPVEPPQAHGRTGAAWVATLPADFDVAAHRRAADEILAGRFPVFALRPAHIGFPPEWNRDPKTGVRAPLRFGKTLDYRNEALVGDIKYLWEPSRHAQLVTLAQAWHLSRDPKYANGCRTLLATWFEQCPYPSGVHWTSSLEHAIRLLNWSFAWHLLGGNESVLFEGEQGDAFRQQWLASIYRHCHFIAGHFSRYSSANNHLIGELTGLLVAATTWPLWKRSKRWRNTSQRELEREALRQNGEDGVNREQATWYHHEVADMMIVAALVARANGSDFGRTYYERLRAMLTYIASIMDAGGHVPNFGDADDAIIARLDPAQHVDVYRSLLATGAVLFESAELKFKAGAFDDKSRWLLGDSAAARYEAIRMTDVALPPRRDFPQAGYFVLGDRFETKREMRVVADAGPLGYLSIAAHGHADALSFTLSAGGQEVLIDPGTYAYHTQKRWRDYFRGTSAHNTVRVDRCDQSVIGGNFLWLKHANAQVLAIERTPLSERLIASHEGYLRLKDPVTHRREILYEREPARLLVTDELICNAGHEVEIFWHFAEACSVVLDGRVVRATRGDVAVSLVVPEGLQCDLRHGVDGPQIGGWISRSFDTKVPTTTAVFSGRIAAAARFVTILQVSL
jgi:hypothetical protein